MRNGMVDFHTHILPGIDDGCRKTEESLELLRLERKMGVDTVVLTPHFYADENSPARFLERRSRAWDRLREQLEPGMPRLLLGAEVQYFEGIGNVEDISSLCIEGTNLLLLEMPFSHWDDRMLRTVMDLHSYGGVRIVLAHIERYRREQPRQLWEELRDFGILAQVNASFFDGFWTGRTARAMMKARQFQLIGTDCHNLHSRKPNWDLVPGDAKAYAAKNARRLLFGSNE